MPTRLLVVLLALGLFVTGCAGEGDAPADMPAQDTQASEDLFGLPAEDTELSRAAKVVAERRQARRDTGDTLSMATSELKQYLPATIAGYTSGTPSVEYVTIPGMSMSRAGNTYTSKNGETITINLFDYNASMSGWESATSMFALPISLENDTEVSKTFQTDDPLINGFENLRKSSKEATVLYALGGRFVLEVKATNQLSLEKVRSVATSVDLKKLSGL